jgi:hypothetical protein
MPMPIKKIEDKVSGNFLVDYSLLLKSLPPDTKNKIVKASDADANLLMKLWETAEKISENVYKIAKTQFSQEDILRLKAHGFLTGGSEEVKFTPKAKVILTTMVLGESNRFQKEQKQKSYTEIIASMDHRGQKGYRVPKYAANNSNFIRLG